MSGFDIPEIRPSAVTQNTTDMVRQLAVVSEQLKHAAAAALASGIIAASGRPHSVKEALEVKSDVYWALYPSPGHGRYQAWEKSGKAEKIHE